MRGQIYSQFSPIEDKEKLVELAVSYQPFWDIANGKTLCYDCHDLIHKRNNLKGESEWTHQQLPLKERLSGLIAKKVNKIAFLKSGELLGNQETGNQQPSLFKEEGSETRDISPTSPRQLVYS